MVGGAASQTLLTVADIIRGQPTAQELFAKMLSRPPAPGVPIPVGSAPSTSSPQDALLHVISLAVSSAAQLPLRAAAAYTFKARTTSAPRLGRLGRAQA